MRSCTRWTCKCGSDPHGKMDSTADAPRSVKTKLQVQVKRAPGSYAAAAASAPDHEHYASTFDAIAKITKAEGVAGLYAGMMGSLIGVASTNFAYFYWYTIVRTLYLRYSAAPGTAAELGLGAVAGAVAQLFTIPVAVVTTRQQTTSKLERKGLLATGKEVIDSEDGWTGLWRGLKASLVLVVNPAITYGAYQRLKESLFPGRTALKPWEAFGTYSEPSVKSVVGGVAEPQTTLPHSTEQNLLTPTFQPSAPCPKPSPPSPPSPSSSPK